VSRGPLVLTYHAIEAGPPPLCIEPALFRRQLEEIAASTARVVPLRELVNAAEAGSGDDLIAITFDDGFASVVESALPALAEHGLPATIFCVAGHLGGRNDWPTEPARSPRLPLASGEALADARRSGPVEIGSHGMSHEPLAALGEQELDRELLGSKAALEDATGLAVDWLAYPYGEPPRGQGMEMVRRAYAGACAGGNERVGAGARYEVPRVDPHYLRRPARLRAVLEGRDSHLRLRRAGARVRRWVRSDHSAPPRRRAG
jgi:peptidoglycan/xylan/chitin deacetylase (PgdA/CDA1 family)